MTEFKTDAQKEAFDKLFNAKFYNHYGDNGGWVTARQIEVNHNILKALVRQGIAEHKHINSWSDVNENWYRLK